MNKSVLVLPLILILVMLIVSIGLTRPTVAHAQPVYGITPTPEPTASPTAEPPASPTPEPTASPTSQPPGPPPPPPPGPPASPPPAPPIVLPETGINQLSDLWLFFVGGALLVMSLLLSSLVHRVYGD